MYPNPWYRPARWVLRHLCAPRPPRGRSRRYRPGGEVAETFRRV